MITNLTDIEKLMYRIISRVSETDSPIVFKGALIAKLALEERQYTGITRATIDIDGSWMENPPEMKRLTDIFNRTLATISETLHVVATREHGDVRSAGLEVYDGDEYTGIKIDIDMKPAIGSRDYYYGDAVVTGVLPSEILADKIQAISNKKVFRRLKDLVDIYSLSSCYVVNVSEIIKICNLKGKEMGNFAEFLTQHDDLRHAYSRLGRIYNKPDFEVVYQHVKKIIVPFTRYFDVSATPKQKSLDSQLSVAIKKTQAQKSAPKSPQTNMSRN